MMIEDIVVEETINRQIELEELGINSIKNMEVGSKDLERSKLRVIKEHERKIELLKELRKELLG